MPIERVTLGGVTYDVLSSASYLWVFDTGRCRFQRLPREASLDVSMPPDGWQPYVRLDIDAQAGTFVVVLDEAGTSLLTASFESPAVA